MRNVVLLILAVGFAVARIVGVKGKSFQAFAHLFVGGLAGAWMVGRDPAYAVLFWALCIVEVSCFLLGRFRPTPPIEGKVPPNVLR